MNTIGIFEVSNIYELSTLILGVASLIMGVTLLTLRGALKNSGSHSKLGLIFLAIAMFVLSAVNLMEYITGVNIKKEQHSLSILVFAASLELFLLFAAHMSMLSKEFMTKRRIYIELGCIALFTIPAMLVSIDNYPLLFNVLFIIGLVFYGVKFVFNYYEYRKHIKKTKAKIENFFSDDSRLWLKWIINTYYVILLMGVISIVIPMTNLTVLMFYNIFIMSSFIYIYISVIRNVPMFNKSMSILDGDEKGIVENAIYSEISLIPHVSLKPTADFMSTRQQLLDDWIAARGYAVVGITATEVAIWLKTNRTRLSYHLKNEKHTTYYEWIAALRIEDAKKQLVEYPDRTIYEIALNVGIEDRDNFRRVFQRYVGVSPTIYRKQYIKDSFEN